MSVTPEFKLNHWARAVPLALLTWTIPCSLMAQDNTASLPTPPYPAVPASPDTTPMPPYLAMPIPPGIIMPVTPDATMAVPGYPAVPPFPGTAMPTVPQASTGPAPRAADTFALFEPTDQTPGVQTPSVVDRNRDGDDVRNPTLAPVFTLMGTSRIGSQRHAILKHAGGEVVRVALNTDFNAIPGHEAYAVLNQGAGRVALRFPAAVRCAEFLQQGVSCNPASNMASLRLVTAAAIVPEQPVAELATDSAADQAAAPEEANRSRNPFAVLRERNRAAALNPASFTGENFYPGPGARVGDRFQPRRIAPEEVPPGMRVISTPFGDRLVEQ